MFAMAVASLASCEDDDDDSDVGVVINGVTWATRNVDAPGRFAASPEIAGKFYQWNRKVAYPATGTVTDWDSDMPSGTEWAKANDPSPSGWRVPSIEEIRTLLDTEKVTSEWTTENEVNGRRFTDKTTGNSIFFPVTSYRTTNGTFYGGVFGNCWSCTEGNSSKAFDFFFDNAVAHADNISNDKREGHCIRPVKE
jgi:uncharacterized protein (TIGR02145 family)